MKKPRKVSLKVSWVELFGHGSSDMPEQLRRDRWEEWKRIQRKKTDEASPFESAEGCEGCIHLDGDWCKLMGLPCSVNPRLTMKHGIIGMACSGVGYEQAVQQQLFAENGIPF